MIEDINVKEQEQEEEQEDLATQEREEDSASESEVEDDAYDEDDDDDEYEDEESDEEESKADEKTRLEEEYWASFDSSAEVVFRKRIKIFPDKHLAEYDNGPVRAFQAKGIGKIEGDFVALVCEPHLLPRTKATNVYANLVNSNMARLYDYGLVYWAPLKKQRLVYIYHNNFGKRLLKPNAPHAVGMKQDFVLDSIVRPLFGVLMDFRNKDFVHGSIRPSNIFDGGHSGDGMKAVLGDCLTTPCSYNQNIIYETIPRGMAHPLGRGIGTPLDDLYSFGVTITVLMRSKDPMEGLSDDEIIRRKVDLGSYAALTGKDRFKGSILELLRGLLHDDPAARWDMDDMETWLGGSRINPKQSSLRKRKAPRPFPFNGNRYFYMEYLAKDLSDNPPELEKILEAGDLQQWISRSLEDDEKVEMLELAYSSSHKDGKSGDYMDRLASHISAALDPYAPMRYQDYSMRADAFGHFLVQALINKEDPKPFVDMISKGTVMNWITNYTDQNLDKVTLMSRFDSCRNYLRQNKVGYGVERCVYTLLPYMHCLSPKLDDFIVRTPDELVMAFEAKLRNGMKPELFLDRHSIAFLAARDGRVIEGALFDLDGEHRHKKILANLLTFAVIQKKAALGPLPHLSNAFVEMMPEVLEHFHDRELRQKMLDAVTKYAKDGNLYKMADVSANVRTFNKDFKAFKSAMVEYYKITNELMRIDRKIENKGTFGRNLSGDIAAFISSMLAGIAIITLTFLFLEGKVLFDFY